MGLINILDSVYGDPYNNKARITRAMESQDVVRKVLAIIPSGRKESI